MISGPLLLSKYFYQHEIKKYDLDFDDIGINFNRYQILTIYPEYRKEQKEQVVQNTMQLKVMEIEKQQNIVMV
jgi:hypothetical protein